MKIIREPKIAITTEELTKLKDLKARNPICNIINCVSCSCSDCPFDTLTSQVDDLLSQVVEIAEALPIYKKGD